MKMHVFSLRFDYHSMRNHSHDTTKEGELILGRTVLIVFIVIRFYASFCKFMY
jgi:hypothetical protein